jgi:phospholipid/cholesterol/gamma-HCH transport system permease protein
MDASEAVQVSRQLHTGRGCGLKQLLQQFGAMSFFALRVLTNAVRPPFEIDQFTMQLLEVGWKSLPLILASGLSLGTVMAFHTRSTLVALGATAMIPSVQADAFFIEIGPLITALLIAGRVGSGIGAVLANMRATEQIDGIEALSVDSFKLLVVPRVLACIVALPLLTLFMDFTALLGGFLSEHFISHISFYLYVTRAFTGLGWSNFIPPVLKTSVFGFIIGSVSSYFGYTTNEGANGVGRAATNSVVVSSLVIILADVILIRCIFFLFPETAI